MAPGKKAQGGKTIALIRFFSRLPIPGSCILLSLYFSGASMRIGIVCYPTYGGSGTVATELGKNLARRGNKVHFITTALPYRLSDYYENIYFHEVQVLNYPLFDYVPYTLSLASKIAQVAHREELDLIHAHYAVPHATAGYLAGKIIAKQGKVLPTITTLHGTDITLVGTDPSYFDITKFSIEESAAVTAVSKYLKRQTLYRFAVENSIEVIPNFVDTDKFRPVASLDRALFAEPDEKILMHISNFRPVKRIWDIIAVFEEVAKKIPARLLLIGNGPEKEPAVRLCEERGLSGKIRFLDRQVDVSRLLPLADMYLLLSEHESFGLTALEAMSCAVPVLGTSGSGMDEFVGEGKAGLLFAVGDISAMAEGALRILKNPDVARALGARGRARVEEQYREDIITSQYVELYERMIR
jgi:N-acetyl-alpha-D-glucosaminyl L-malate synthase BshA